MLLESCRHTIERTVSPKLPIAVGIWTKVWGQCNNG